MISVEKTTLATIADFRKQFLTENNIQFVLDKCHRYGWADTYLFQKNGVPVGYGSVWGKDRREDRDAIFEFFLVQGLRDAADEYFTAFCLASKAPWIECQTNDKFLFPMLEKFSSDVVPEAILFADSFATDLKLERVSLQDRPQPSPDDRQYVLLCDGQKVGEGGFMLNYNFPYADMYFAIDEQYRRNGFGSFFVQELKKEIYKIGRVPAARCNRSNMNSKATMLKAGMAVCGFRSVGKLIVSQVPSIK